MSVKTSECPNYLMTVDVEALYKQEVKGTKADLQTFRALPVWPTTHIEPLSRLGDFLGLCI